MRPPTLQLGVHSRTFWQQWPIALSHLGRMTITTPVSNPCSPDFPHFPLTPPTSYLSSHNALSPLASGAALRSVLQFPSWLPCKGVLSLLQTLVSQHFGLCRVRQQIWFTNICCFLVIVILTEGFPGSTDGKESACSAGDLGSIPGLERSPGEGNGYAHHYSCLENSMHRGGWWATVHGVTKSQTWLNN